MAELGDYLEQGPSSQKEITVDMMDYKYVDTCEDASELRAILCKLRSNEEGHFPHLESTIEEKLMNLLSEKERRKVKLYICSRFVYDLYGALMSLGLCIVGDCTSHRTRRTRCLRSE